jgi:hypothetical protein
LSSAFTELFARRFGAVFISVLASRGKDIVIDGGVATRLPL